MYGRYTIHVTSLDELEQYRLLIIKECWRVWMRLPQHTRIWLGLEDLVQEATGWVWHVLIPAYDPTKGCKFSTFMVDRLRQRLDTKITEVYTAQKRHEGKTISIQEMAEIAEQKEDFALDRIVKRAQEDWVSKMQVSHCHIVEKLPVLYRQATPILKRQIVHWFLRPGGHYQLKGHLFAQTSREFRRLARRHSILIDDCRHMVRSPQCLDKVSRAVLGIPASMEFPTPNVERGTVGWLAAQM